MKNMTLRQLGAATFLRAVLGVVAIAAAANCSSDSSSPTPLSIAITPTAASIRPGDTVQFTVTATLPDAKTADVTGAATYVSSATAVLTVDASGNGVGVALGSAFVVATYKGLSTSAAVTVDAVAATLTSIAVTPVNPTIAVGTTQAFVATGSYSNNTTRDLSGQVTWTSSVPTVATITSGTATAVSAGSSIITASLGTVSGTATLTVNAATIVSIALTPSAPSTAAGSTVNFTATATFSNNTTQDVSAGMTTVWTSSTPAIATVASPGRALALAAGVTTIEATVGAVKGSTTLTVTAATLVSIAVTPPNPSVAGGTTQQFTATGTFSDNTTQDLTGSVVWSSGMTNIATIVGNSGLARGVAVGTSDVRATVGAIVGTTNLTVTQATLVSISVSPTTPTVPLGSPSDFTATGTYSDNSTQDLTDAVTWSSATIATATISNATNSEGNATTLAVGTSVITATMGLVNASTTLTVTAATLASIEIAPALHTIANGTTQQFTATGTFTDNTTQDLTTTTTWASGSANVATISNATDSEGLATSVAAGTTTITATSGAIIGTTTLTVSAATLVSIAVTPATPAIAKGTDQLFAATGTYSDNSTQDLTTSVTWSSGTPATATISNATDTEGLASSVLEGTTLITATLGAISGSTTLTVSAATLASIAVTPTNPTLAKGTNDQLTATGTYTDNATQDLTASVTWNSTMTGVATVSGALNTEGRLTAVLEGTTTVTATLGAIVGGTTVTVSAATLASISVTPPGLALPINIENAYTATGTYTDNTTQDLSTQVTWSSNAQNVATVSNADGTEGVAVGIAPGSATISATLGAIVGNATLTITNATLVSVAVTPASPTAPLGTVPQFIATGTYSDSSSHDITSLVLWGSSVPAVATISNAPGSQGQADTVSVGNTIVTATLSNISGPTVLTVSAAALASISVDPSSPTTAAGTTRRFSATGRYTDNSTQDLTTLVTWSSLTTAVAVISNAEDDEGLATGLTVGSSVISATLGSIVGTTTLGVTAATLVSIAVTPNTASIANGTSQTFVATGTYTDGSTQDLSTQVTWSSSMIGIAVVSNAADSEGEATGLAQGSSTITAALGNIQDAAVLTVTPATLVSIGVTPATPSIAKGTTQQFVATGRYTDNSTQDLTVFVTWASTMTGVASISNADYSEGLATSAIEGGTTISATIGNVVGSTTLTVTAATLASIAVTPSTPSIPVGVQIRFTATGSYTDGSTQNLTSAATWGSSMAAATVSNGVGTRGFTTSVSAGATVISATVGAIVGSTNLTVNNATLTSITLAPVAPSLPLGYSQQMAAVGVYSDASNHVLTDLGTWGTLDSNVATVSNAVNNKGLTDSVGVGNTSVFCTYQGVTGTTGVGVTAALLTGISITPSTPSVAKGRNVPFVATGTFSNNSTQNITTSVTWSSSMAAVTISNADESNGLATAAAVGSSTITATLGNISATTVMTVTDAVLTQIQVSPPNPTTPNGLDEQFVATGIYSDNTNADLTDVVTWTSSMTGVATISNAEDSAGLASTLTVGSSTIGAAIGSVSGSATLTVSAALLNSIAVFRKLGSIAKGTTQVFYAEGTYSDTSVIDITDQVTWDTSNMYAATVSNGDGSQGLVTAVAVGTANISASLDGKSGMASITVTDATLVSIAVTPTAQTTPKGLTVQYTATGTYTDQTTQNLTATTTWAVGDSNLASISNANGSQGLLTALNVGTTPVTATSGTIVGQTTVTISSAVVMSIAITPATPTTAVNAVEYFIATATLSDNTTSVVTSQATWQSSNTTVASISNVDGARGWATALVAGTSTITATLGSVSGTTLMTVGSPNN
jgi:Bacterial Ig-like domain (group 2)